MMTPKGMIMLLFLVILAALTISLLGQIGNSISAAIAENSRLTALERQQAIDHREQSYQAKMAHEAAIAPTKIWARKIMLVAGSLAAVVVLVSVAVGASWWAIGYGRGQARAAEMHAMLIPLDATTRQYPLLPFVAGGKLRAYNPNTGQVLALSDNSSPIPQLADGSSKVQIAGLIQEEYHSRIALIRKH